MSTPLTITEVLSLCSSPWGLDAFSPLGESNYLLLDIADSVGQSNAGNLDDAANRLRLLPCPVIAVGTEIAPALLRGVDVVVTDLQGAAPLITRIDEHPLAAMTLVQLLRHNEDVSPMQGLFAESLAYASLQGGIEFAQALKTGLNQPHEVFEQGNPVVIERKGDELYITLNRPQARNAYSSAMRDNLYEALQLLQTDGELQRAVVSGNGRCFCIGGDLNEFGIVSDTSTAHAIRSSRSVGQLLLAMSEQLEFRLHRACIGAGIELPAFAARVVADHNTFVQLPEITFGLLPGAGGTVSLLRRIGRHRTAYLALSARKINARTAREWGLVDALV